MDTGWTPGRAAGLPSPAAIDIDRGLRDDDSVPNKDSEKLEASDARRRPDPAVAEFGRRLQRLRVEAGSPSFRKLAKMTHYSSSTCAEATAGRRLPTEAVVKAFVTACGADPAEWLALHRKAAAAVGAPEPSPAAAAEPAESYGRRHRTAILVACVLTAGLVIGAAVASLTSFGTSDAAPSAPLFTLTPSSPPSALVGDGVDPGVGGCKADKKLVDRSPVMIDGAQVGALDLLYSPHCGAGWAELYLYPGQRTMLGSVTVASDDQRSSSISDPLVKQVDVYTDVVVPAKGGCLSASAQVFTTGRRPIAASIRCQAMAP